MLSEPEPHLDVEFLNNMEQINHEFDSEIASQELNSYSYHPYTEYNYIQHIFQSKNTKLMHGFCAIYDTVCKSNDQTRLALVQLLRTLA